MVAATEKTYDINIATQDLAVSPDDPVVDTVFTGVLWALYDHGLPSPSQDPLALSEEEDLSKVVSKEDFPFTDIPGALPQISVLLRFHLSLLRRSIQLSCLSLRTLVSSNKKFGGISVHSRTDLVFWMQGSFKDSVEISLILGTGCLVYHKESFRIL